MNAMRCSVTFGRARVILTAAKRITGLIRRHSRRECSGGAHAALHVRILLGGGIRAVGHDVRAVLLDRAEHAAGRTARRTARAGRTTAAAFTGAGCRTRRTGRVARIFIAATDSKSRSSSNQEAYEKNIRFGHRSSISR